MASTKLTEKRALRAFHAIMGRLDGHLGYEGRLIAATKNATPTRQGAGDPQWGCWPVLCRDFEGWSSTSAWAVVWEGGDEEWPFIDSLRDAGLLPDGVGVEAINGFALSLYRKD